MPLVPPEAMGKDGAFVAIIDEPVLWCCGALLLFWVGRDKRALSRLLLPPVYTHAHVHTKTTRALAIALRLERLVEVLLLLLFDDDGMEMRERVMYSKQQGR